MDGWRNFCGQTPPDAGGSTDFNRVVVFFHSKRLAQRQGELEYHAPADFHSLSIVNTDNRLLTNAVRQR